MNKTKKRTVYGTHVTLPGGERVYVSGKTKQERRDKVQQMKRGGPIDVSGRSRTLFEEYAYRWLKAYKSPPKLREQSYVIVKANLEHHVLPFFEGRYMDDIMPIDLQDYLTSISGYSKSLQAKCVQIVKSIFRTAQFNRLISFSPVDKDSFKAGGAAAEEEEPLTPEQAQQLLDAVRGTRAYTFCLLALTTGLRRGELLGLMWEDIDLESDHPCITVKHNKAFIQNQPDAPVTTLTKTEAAHRKLSLTPAVAEHLRREREQTTSEFVISMQDGRSLTRSSFRSLWRIVDTRTEGEGRAIGEARQGRKEGLVSLDFNCHPHQLRHTFLTRLFEAGCDLKQVQYLAGHSKPEMTLRVYLHYQAALRAKETSERVTQAVGMLA